MADPDDSIASLMARREYVRAVPLLRRDLEKYPTNVRIRLQLADALAGAGIYSDAIEQYELTAKFYDDNGLIVQAIAVRKKLDKVKALQAVAAPVAAAREPQFQVQPPKSPLFEVLSKEERDALVSQMVLEEFNEGDIVITEGEEGSSLYVVVSGLVKVYTRGQKGENFYLANLGEGEFFGEVSVLTGKPRTATVVAAQKTELLRLDKENLDRLVEEHPRVRDVLEQFYKKRASHTVEAMIESMKKRS